MVTGDHGHPGHFVQKHVEGEFRQEQDIVTILLHPREGDSVKVPAPAAAAVIRNHVTQVCHPSWLL